jgi:hypothetical protein
MGPLPGALPTPAMINQGIPFGDSFQTAPPPSLDSENKKGTMFCIRSSSGRAAMLKIFVQEAAALASITLFVGMIAVWAQLITQF